MNARGISARVLGVGASFGLAVALASFAPATARGSLGGTWSVVASPNVGTLMNALSGVAATSASNAWAVGSYVNSAGGDQPLIEQWNGHAWSVVPPPSSAGVGSLGGVTATSASNAWAVGAAGGKTLILHCC